MARGPQFSASYLNAAINPLYRCSSFNLAHQILIIFTQVIVSSTSQPSSHGWSNTSSCQSSWSSACTRCIAAINEYYGVICNCHVWRGSLSCVQYVSKLVWDTQHFPVTKLKSGFVPPFGSTRMPYWFIPRNVCTFLILSIFWLNGSHSAYRMSLASLDDFSP
jgi:hypothetical protein